MREPLGLNLPRPGSQVGPWRVEGHAGQGGYGRVYRARGAGVPGAPLVALKVAVFPSDPRFEHERELLSRALHPAIPRLLDWGWWEAGPGVSHPYLVLEWVRGLSLYEWARVHGATQRQMLQVLAQVAEALAALHAADGLHRDVKGDNMLVEPEGRARLMDFGSGTWKGAPPITGSFMPPNTPEYRSPESLRCEWKRWNQQGARYRAGPADDVYALGVAVYRAVTRVYPPPGTAPEAFKAHTQEPLARRPPAHALNPRVGPELSALLEDMLAGEPEARSPAAGVAEAARAAAGWLGPEGDVPLFEPERAATRDWVSRTLEAAPPGAGRGAGVEPVVVTAQGGPSVAAWSSWRVGVVALLVLAGLGTWWAHSGRPPRGLELARSEALDVGTSGLGESPPPPPVASSEALAAEEARAVMLELPRKPLPGQRRAPCRFRGDVEINGGCWRRQADVPAPCGVDAYEWQGQCYEPAAERALPKNAKDP